jgi:hypothetical protein
MASSKVVYHGRSFRSHLPARWAVFYDTLGIVYFCDCQDYDLDGMLCCPDFYLPEFNCFIVAQEQFPSPAEEEMYTRLSTCTGRDIYVPFGNMEIPSDDAVTNEIQEAAYLSACHYSPAEVWVDRDLQPDQVKLDLPQHFVWLFYRACFVYKLSLRNRASSLVIAPFEKYEDEDRLQDEAYRPLKESEIALPATMTQIVRELKRYESGILHFLPEGFRYEILAAPDYSARWYECSICQSLEFSASSICQCSERSGSWTLATQSPLLLAAYNAAKQTPF